MRFDEPVTLKLASDEAIVLLYFLSRELWSRGEERLVGCTEHPAELHALHSLLQELIPPLLWTGDPNNADEISRAAYAAVIARYTAT